MCSGEPVESQEEENGTINHTARWSSGSVDGSGRGGGGGQRRTKKVNVRGSSEKKKGKNRKRKKEKEEENGSPARKRVFCALFSSLTRIMREKD